jgi:hypothetical protein
MDTPCIEWAKSRYRNGYGAASIGNGRMGYAHRVAWEQANGPIPAGMLVLHRCDNRPCVNVEHLFLGTQQDNMDDMWSKGRGATGERHGTHTHPRPVHARRPRVEVGFEHGEAHHAAKLTDAEVTELRARVANGESQTALAREYGMSQPGVSLIVNRKTRAVR